jgi:hypothetical protein
MSPAITPVWRHPIIDRGLSRDHKIRRERAQDQPHSLGAFSAVDYLC